MSAVAAALAVVVPSAGAGAAGRAPEPGTLVLASGPIAAFAQDGGRIAWASVEAGRSCPWLVRVRVLARRFQDAVNGRSGPTCRHPTGFEAGETELALAGDRALWTLREAGNFTYVRVVSGALSASSDRLLEELVFDNGNGDGEHLAGLAGDGSSLVYGTVTVRLQGPQDCELNGTCKAVLAGGGIVRVQGGSTRPGRGAPPPVALAVAGRRVALAVAGAVGLRIAPAATPRIEVRDLASGNLVGAFELAGRRLRGLALSGDFVAVLTSVRGSRGVVTRIERYSHRGERIATRTVDTGTAAGLSASGSRIAFRVGRSIRILDTGSGDIAEVARAAATPIGLSIEGRRVAWAENVRIGGKLRGRVRAVTVS
jgi:hypothetical protein